MAVLTTGDLNLPTEILDPWLGKVQDGSAVATLSDSIPMKFGKGEAFIFDIGEAEYVGEGQNKGASTVTKTAMGTDPFKFHKTVRWTEEVMWADEDHQLGVVSQILALIQPALSRALDFGVFHGINPTGGAPVAAMTQKLSDTTNSVELDGADKPFVSLDAADALVVAGGFIPRDAALDPTYGGKFSSYRNATTEAKVYPDFRLQTAVSDLENHRASVSRTAGAVGVAATDTNIKAFVGDFSAIRWGVQKAIGLEVIRYGDPDGQGDLKRNNQVAFRAEVVYGWGIADVDA
ncbi:MAG TPA: phage major capsid protein, partial [Brevibacterium sp.]|nr:phage major capsid protein [Brevibacterium sp.]